MTQLPLTKSAVELDRPRNAHLVGVGGAGMRSLACVLLQRGWRLSGADAAIRCDDPLAQAGMRVFTAHAEQHIGGDIEIVIHSSAIPADNRELRRAAELGIPVASYAQMLGLLMQGRRGLAVAGTHGKSTVTAMAAEIFMAAGHDPTFIYGALPCGDGVGGRAGNGPMVLVEACEFQRNFLELRPHDAVILNTEHDHFDCFATRDEVMNAFRRFAELLPREGTLIVPRDDGNGLVGWDKIAQQSPAHSSGKMVGRRSQARWSHPTVETFGLSDQADWRAVNLQSSRGSYSFDLEHRASHLGRIELAVYGRHNVLNALAAAALAGINGCPVEAIVAGLSRYRGLRRRLECIYEAGSIAVFDDYAHHPTEISATLATIREIVPGSRLQCLFQPHQASRTARLLDELALSLQNAERVLIADIFRAREGPQQPGGVTAADLADRTRALGQDVFGSHAPLELQQHLQTTLAPGDALVVMGAGDIGRTVHGIVDWLRNNRAAG